MPKVQALATKLWCTTSLLQAGKVTTSALLRKRVAQRTSLGGNESAAIPGSTTTAGIAPMVVYPSNSGANNSNQDLLPSSPTSPTSKILLATLSGASAFSVIGLAVFLIFRKYKLKKGISRDLGSSNSSYSLRTYRQNGGLTTIEKCAIRHVTHDEQRERYRSLFGVPAGYLRPKSRSVRSQGAGVPTVQITRCSESLRNVNIEVQNDPRFSLSDESPSTQENFTCEMIPVGSNTSHANQNGRKGVTRLDEERTFQNFNSERAEKEKPYVSRFLDQFPNLAARLKRSNEMPASTTKIMSRDNQVASNVTSHRDLKPILTVITEKVLDEPRSPSIAPTPPNYLKSPSTEGPQNLQEIDVALVVDRLRRHQTISRGSFHGRGDSYYWKSPIRHQQAKQKNYF